jgi:nucleotide sugar dehydrogenase
VTNIPRVVGSFEEKGLEKTVRFYESIIDAKIMPMKTIFEAEAVKIMENSFRDINIAFANELAKSFDLMGIDAVNVIRGASTKPFAFMTHWPSCGVGGHCIPVDPYYLIEKAKENDFDHQFLRLARAINNGMPEYTVGLIKNLLKEAGKTIKDTSVGLLGVSYKANVGDLRESPALEIIELLKKNGAKLDIYDPFVLSLSTVKNIDELLEKTEVLVLATGHNEFKKIPPEKFRDMGIKVIVDGINCLDKDKILALGIKYKGIGR